MAFIKWNFKQFIEEYLPIELRTTIRMKWLNALSEGIVSNYNSLIERRDVDLFLSKHTSQVASLEHFLNNKLEIVGKPIKIIDSESFPLYYINNDSEPLSLFQDNYSYQGTDVSYFPNNVFIGSDNDTIPIENEVFLGSDKFYVIDTVDFIVLVDNLDFSKASQIRYYIDYYKIAGFTYKILVY